MYQNTVYCQHKPVLSLYKLSTQQPVLIDSGFVLSTFVKSSLRENLHFTLLPAPQRAVSGLWKTVQHTMTNVLLESPALRQGF